MFNVVFKKRIYALAEILCFIKLERLNKIFGYQAKGVQGYRGRG